MGTFIIFMYVVTSFFAIVLYYTPAEATLDDYSTFSIGLIPTFLYCVLISLCAYPYYILNTNEKKVFIRIKNVRYFNLITYFYIAIFFILLFLFYNDIFEGILKSNFADLREDAENDDLQNSLTRLSNPLLRYIGFIAASIGYCGGFMIPFFFYSICFTKNSSLHNILILTSTLSSIVMGIIAVDRSCVVLWTLMFALSYFLFKPYLNKRNSSLIKKVIIGVGGVLGLYFVSMTISRFYLTDMGAGGSVVSYIGQPFLNYTNVWENIEVSDVSTRYIFPAYNRFVLGTDPDNHVLINKTSHYVRTNGFSTFLGMMYLSMGKILSIIVPLFIALFTYGRINKIKRRNIITFKDFMYIFFMGIIILYGCIAYYYYSHESTIDLIIMLFLLSRFKFEKYEKYDKC